MKALLVVAVLMLTVGCGSNYKVKQESTENTILNLIPEWYIDSEEKRGLLDRKNKHGYIYGVGTAVSSNLQLAVEKAMMIAKADLADQIAGQVNKDTEYSVVEAGDESSVEMATETNSSVKNVVRQISPVGYEEWNKSVLVTAKQQYRVYVGLKWTRSKKNRLSDLISSDLVGGVEVVPSRISVEIQQEETL